MEGYNTSGHVFKTDGEIILRTAEFDDAARISNYFTVNRDYLKPWEPKREEAFFSELGWQQRLIKLSELHKMSLGFYLLIIDADSDEMLGTISFSNISRFPFYACNVGYSLAEQAQGKQIMTRALKMACDYMFNEQNLHRVMASYMPHNKRSEAVLQRLGFVHEGQAKDYLLIDGQWQDHNLTSLVNPNWKE
ncbi:ribosomal protein S5-alanine N-acetyltransferase [Vibrio fluvialis]|jgi:ribosomal-protein-alanine N-acetyltransferase|uniref:30S ribosomal protein S5 alanine N-acetyltransferase n=1 Tax=Vibrio fluvialis TaxID=676 RepID=A0AAX2LQZ9_VIBFL|nr:MULTISPECIES: ribosomal protein S5-alanine N-acetyltransferase [Vibrio]TNF17210.1 MAG: 30S ribosomal protein S5 alanine N-acetyltransferase [Vibrionaceae bacterium]AMF94384.1 30S ribosomal protein S5 alanine N-acetyltransferase [Vibrio fluvialis]EKO3367474.1 ribosomal protein S5-alanine N-acetyltransferase [Vibrio fluvialis]EKO3372511.1 ribosomal protein S5-alanine N-acetyltransferase [Vibrio fluvialis]EKO3381433.1 ribosomal protein S5-alanine N-acetyltransferase [Vibrio fluvialis]